MKRWSVAVGEGRYAIGMEATLIGKDLSVVFSGGEVPHIGGVVLSVPRPSLTGTGTGCDTWVIPVPGHKDGVVAQPVAEMLCRATGQRVVVTGGIHIEGATSEEIEVLRGNVMEGAQKLTEKILEDKMRWKDA